MHNACRCMRVAMEPCSGSQFYSTWYMLDPRLRSLTHLVFVPDPLLKWGRGRRVQLHTWPVGQLQLSEFQRHESDWVSAT